VGQVSTFAKIPAPGQPEGIAIDPSDGSVWSGSNKAHSKAVIWHHASDGTLLQTYEVQGHSDKASHAINGIALDGQGRVYALDYDGARAIRLDPRTGTQEVYATFADLPTCAPQRSPCEPGLLDRPAWPNWPTFDARGNLYVSDLNQATIWKVPPGGGQARIWYQGQDLASIYSLNGMQFDAQGRLNVMFTLSTRSDTFLQGVVYRFPVLADGRAGPRETVGASCIGDGLTIGLSGRLYLPCSQPFLNRLQVMDPESGRVLDSYPNAAVQRQLEIPFDTPASAAFRGKHLLITNHALITQDARHFAILRLDVGEAGLPLFYPLIAEQITQEIAK
jgi:sugar lactone lactonase YvrE